MPQHPIEPLECHWQPSRRLLQLYLLLLGLALCAVLLADVPWWAKLAAGLLCLLHGGWSLPRQILLTHPAAFTGLRHDGDGWQLRNSRDGWLKIQLCRDSLALPAMVVLRFRLVGERWTRGLCVPRDALAPDVHRRLRVRLKFTRNRWAAPE